MIDPNSKILKLYGLPKIHKTDIPIKPVLSYVDIPTYSIQVPMYNLENTPWPKYDLKNSLELIDSLKGLDIPNGAVLISLDAKNLYTFQYHLRSQYPQLKESLIIRMWTRT